jgi:glutathione S-transferase
MFDVYNSSLLGIWLILATIIVQAMVAVRVHRRQSGGYSPGVIKSELGQSSIVFRAHRTFQNSLENIIPVLGMAIVAMLSGYSAYKLSIIIWVYAISRIIHMILYYKIATNKNPSPRSIFWAIGFLASFYLMIDLGIFLLIN